MAFATGHLDDPQKAGSGELLGTSHIALAAITFEDGLKIGRFAKLDTGSIDNMDSSGTPVIAGVVLRNDAGIVEDGGTIDSAVYGQIEYLRQGLVTVDAKTGESPTLFSRVYANNDATADAGLATVDATDVDTNAEFITEIQTDVWLIYINPAPGDVATHVSAAAGAHAASAISLASGLTAQVEVEAVIAEMLPFIPVAIVDPGVAGAISVTRTGVCLVTTAAAETRTLAIPSFIGQSITLTCDVYDGDAVVTVAAAINQDGNTVITLNTAGDTVALRAVQVAGALVWRLVVNDGATLS
jgi:hypothetical protein